MPEVRRRRCRGGEPRGASARRGRTRRRPPGEPSPLRLRPRSERSSCAPTAARTAHAASRGA
eukprot:1916134-Pyramimonas_sp.AAC.1